MSYAALHCHSHYSIDGIGTIKQWVSASKKKGLYGLAITDHGECSSLLELYTIGQKEKFPVVMGCEIYLIESLDPEKHNRKYYHLTVMVKNFEGYKNLCRLSAISYRRDHFYYKPRVTFDELFAHKEGLIIGSGCLAGPLCKQILKKTGLEEDYLKIFHKEFKDDYYLELQPSVVIDDTDPDWEKVNKQEVVNRTMIEFSKRYEIPLIITPDAHIVESKMKVLQTIKLNARSGGKGNWEFEDSYHLLEPDELKANVAKHHSYMVDVLDEAMANTKVIVDKAQFQMPKFEPLLPNVDIAKHRLYQHGDDPQKLLMRILMDNKRIDFTNKIHVERLKYEINTLCHNGVIDFLNYFLLLEDVVRWCKANDITVGPGRGSASGSLLVYGLKITHLDPIKYSLSFDRFINKGRITQGTFPDVDMDFSDPQAVKKYVIERYGEEYVAIMGVFQTLKTKGAIKDVLGVLRPDMPFEDKNKLTSTIPQSPQGSDELIFFHEHLKTDEVLLKFMTENRDIYESVVMLLGQSRQRGRHPCAVVVSSKPLIDIMPLFNDNDEWVTQYSADWCKKVGVVKYDFLGLNTLTDIAECLKLIKQNHGIDIDPYDIPWDDKKTLEAFARADTETVFQFHTHVGKSILKLMSTVDGLEDLAAITALGRPGPMDVGMDKHYISRKNGVDYVEYPHKALEPILSDTYGIMVYQEQVMMSVQILGGFSLEESDEVRRAMGSKNKELLQSYKQRFVQHFIDKYGSGDLESDVRRGDSIWEQIESFARYGFNKSHSVSYAMIGYICQYLRQYYPLEWYCSVFSNGSNDDQKALYPSIKELMVLPEINLSKDRFTIRDSKIVMSLGFIHGLGDRSVEDIVAKQPFTSFEDFVTRVNKRVVKKDVVLNLIFAGCFDTLEPELSKNDLIEKYFFLIKKKGKKGEVPNEYRNMNQIDLMTNKLIALPVADINYADIFKDLIRGNVDPIDHVLKHAAEGKKVSLVGKIEAVSAKTTKKGDKMAFVDLVNENKKVRLTVWPEKYQKLEEVLEEGKFVQIWGAVNIWNQRVSVILEKIKVF